MIFLYLIVICQTLFFIASRLEEQWRRIFVFSSPSSRSITRDRSSFDLRVLLLKNFETQRRHTASDSSRVWRNSNTYSCVPLEFLHYGQVPNAPDNTIFHTELSMNASSLYLFVLFSWGNLHHFILGVRHWIVDILPCVRTAFHNVPLRHPTDLSSPDSSAILVCTIIFFEHALLVANCHHECFSPLSMIQRNFIPALSSTKEPLRCLVLQPADTRAKDKHLHRASSTSEQSHQTLVKHATFKRRLIVVNRGQTHVWLKLFTFPAIFGIMNFKNNRIVLEDGHQRMSCWLCYVSTFVLPTLDNVFLRYHLVAATLCFSRQKTHTHPRTRTHIFASVEESLKISWKSVSAPLPSNRTGEVSGWQNCKIFEHGWHKSQEVRRLQKKSRCTQKKQAHTSPRLKTVERITWEALRHELFLVMGKNGNKKADKPPWDGSCNPSGCQEAWARATPTDLFVIFLNVIFLWR